MLNRSSKNLVTCSMVSQGKLKVVFDPEESQVLQVPSGAVAKQYHPTL